MRSGFKWFPDKWQRYPLRLPYEAWWLNFCFIEWLCGRQEWIVPANPKYYDLQKAFSENEEIIWKQSNNIAVGDVVCLYVTAPVSAVLYRCEAIEVNIPYRYDDGNVHMDHVMRLKKLEQYEPSFLPFEKLKAYGIGAIRGPRRMPHSLI